MSRLELIKKKIRHVWHDLFYMLTPSSVQRLAMTCKEAVDQMNLKDGHSTILAMARLKLHLSLCQACNNYFQLSRALGKEIRKLVGGSNGPDLEKINQELLRKHARNLGP